MRVFAICVVALALVSQLAACLSGNCGGPSAYSGAGDRVYRQGAASLTLCANAGFVTRLADGSLLEGTYVESNASGVATTGGTTSVAFDYSIATDGSLTAPQLDAAAWAQLDLDPTDLDHADVQCTDLRTRAWWPTSAP